MKVRIKRIDKTLPLPEYHSLGAAGFDIYSRIDGEVKPGEDKFFPSNLVVEIPKGYLLAIAARGSLFKKKGLILANSLGIIDWDFRGDEDEIVVQLFNPTQKTAKVEKGERIAQGIFIKYDKGDWTEVEKMNNQNRGRHGSTD